MLSRLARAFAAEIASHDWADSPYRLDRAGHQRNDDKDGKRIEQPLSATETANVRTNVAWVTAQVLRYFDPNLDPHEYTAACGVPRSITHRSNGSRSDVITYGLRWKDTAASVAAPPGAPLWRVRVQCEVANRVVFERLLRHVDELADPSLPSPLVESVGGAMRNVTVVVRAWDESAVGQQVVDLVSNTSLNVFDGGGPAVLLEVKSLGNEAE